MKSTTVSHSSTEAEVKALDEAIRQSVWLRGFLKELGFPQNTATVIHVDNQSAQILAEQYRLGNNTSHMVMRLNYIHQEIVNGGSHYKIYRYNKSSCRHSHETSTNTTIFKVKGYPTKRT